MNIRLSCRAACLRYLSLFLFFAFALSGCGVPGSVGASKAPIGPTIGAPAPDFVLEDLEGNSTRLSDFKGRPVMLNFWATWCEPCKKEMPHMQEAQDEFSASTGFTVLAVDLGESKETAKRFLQENNLSFTALLDKDHTVSYGKYKLIGLPTSFFIDRNGIIRDIQMGPLTTKEALMNKLRNVL